MAKAQDRKQQSSTSRGLRGKSRGIADWGTASAELVVRAIERAAITGGAIRFGYSRDGGAYAVGIYGDGDPYTEFCKPSEDLDEFLESIAELFDAIHDEQMKPRGGQKQPSQGDTDA